VRICACLPDGAFDAAGLRVLLVADVLARVAELQGLQALTTWMFPHPPADQESAADHAATLLNIHPPARRAAGGTGPVPADVHVISQVPAAAEAGHDTGTIAVAAAYLPGGGDPGEQVSASADPLATRLALLSCRNAEPADIAGDVAVAAQVTLGTWRRAVAAWAELPSRPVPEHIMTSLRAAAGQLDTAAAVAALHTVAADSAVTPGAKFETFLFADRVLGLDLASGIGQPY